jgi:hypothetical protein
MLINLPPLYLLQNPPRGQLVQGLVVVAALGALDAGGAAVLAGALGDNPESGLPEFGDHVVALLGDADAAGVSVIDENLGLTRIRVHRRGNAADIIPVAQGKEGQDADGGMLGGVESPGEVAPLLGDAGDGLRRDIEPEGDGGEGNGGEVQRLFPDDLLGELAVLLKSDDIDGHLDVTDTDIHRADRTGRPYLKHVQVVDFLGLRVVVTAVGLGVGDMVGQVQPGDKIGIALVEIDGAGVNLEEGDGAFHRFHQRAGGDVNDGIVLPG